METPGMRFGLAPVAALLAAGSCAGWAQAQVDRHWLNPVSDLWTNGVNWTGGSEPAPADSAFLDAVGGPYVVTLDVNRTITNFTMTAPSVGPTVVLASGAALTLTGDYLQEVGTISGSASAAVSVGGSTTLRAATLLDLPSFTAAGNLLFDGSTDIGIRNSTLNHTGVSGTWQGTANLVFGGGAGASGLSLGAASIFTIANDRTASWDNSGVVRPDVSNAGMLIKNGGTGTTSFQGVRLVNSGTVQAATGTLRFDTIANLAGGTLTGGTWQADDNATLDFSGQNVVTNQATVILNGANSNFAAIDSLQSNGAAGTFRLRGGRAFTTQGSLANSGVIDLGAGTSLRIATGNTYNDTAGAVTGAGLTSFLLIDGTANLDGTTISNAHFMSTGMTVIGGGLPVAIDNSCVDHNGFGCVWNSSAGINVGGGTQFNFGGGSMFEIDNAQTMAWDNTGVQPVINMAGMLVRNAAGSSAIAGVALNNTGTVRVMSGTLTTDTVSNVSGGALTGGTWEVMNNATLDFAAQTVTTNNAMVALDGAGATFNAISGLQTNDTGGRLDIKNGKSFITAGSFTNNGTVAAIGDTAPALFKINPGSTLTNYNPGTRTITGGAFIARGAGRDSGTIEVDGLDVATLDAGVTLDGPGATIIDPTAAGDQNALRNLALVDNAGMIDVRGGKNFDTAADLAVAPSGQFSVGLDSTFTVSGNLSNFDSLGAFTDGVFTVGGTLRADNARVVTLGNTLTLDGPARIERPDGMGGFIDALTTLEHITPSGHLTLRHGHGLTLDPHDLETDAGSTLTIGPPAATPGDTFLHVQGNMLHAGTLTLLDGALQVDGSFTNNGMISGNGTIDLPSGSLLVNQGLLSPGNSPGLLHITGGGDLMIDHTGVVRIEIAGLVAGDGYDQLWVDGRMLFADLIAGRLEVTIDPGFTPLPGERFEILRYSGGAEGWFQAIEVSSVFRQIREGDRFVLEVVPAPATGVLLGALGLLAVRRRR